MSYICKMHSNILSSEEKAANAFLRERFLYLLSSLRGKKKSCNISMFENTEVIAQIKAIDMHFEYVIVENLKTPLPDPIQKGILRTSDILTISFK